MKTFNMEVIDKRLNFDNPNDEVIVCGNGDYQIEFEFDSEWDAHDKKTAKFTWNGEHENVEFTGNIVKIPMLTNTTVVTVGVFVGEDGVDAEPLATTKVSILCIEGCRCGDSTPNAGTGASYTNEARGYAAEAKVSAASAKASEEATADMGAEMQAHQAYYDTMAHAVNAGEFGSGSVYVYDEGTKTITADNNEKIPVLPNGLTEIGANAFKTSSIVSVRFPQSLTKIGTEGFFGSIQLKSVVIPRSVVSLGAMSFQNCTNLKAVTFEQGINLKNITAYSFASTGIQSVSIPESVETIKNNAFANCTGLTSINFASDGNLKTIEGYAFDDTNITEFKVPKSVTTIGEDAFIGNYDKFVTVDFTEYGHDTPFPSIGERLFSFVGSGGEILVPKGRKAELANKTNWSDLLVHIREVEV